MPRFRVSPVSRIPGSWLHFACARACAQAPVSFYRVTRSHAHVASVCVRVRVCVCSRTEICTSGYGDTFLPIFFSLLLKFLENFFFYTELFFMPCKIQIDNYINF